MSGPDVVHVSGPLSMDAAIEAPAGDVADMVMDRMRTVGDIAMLMEYASEDALGAREVVAACCGRMCRLQQQLCAEALALYEAQQG